MARALAGVAETARLGRVRDDDLDRRRAEVDRLDDAPAALGHDHAEEDVQRLLEERVIEVGGLDLLDELRLADERAEERRHPDALIDRLPDLPARALEAD